MAVHIPLHYLSMAPPPTGWIKFNFDATIIPNATFISVVGHDPNVMIISVCTAKEPSQSSIWGEAKAALLAMSTTINLGYKFVIFEGDAKVVIESIVCSSSDLHGKSLSLSQTSVTFFLILLLQNSLSVIVHVMSLLII